MKIFMSYGHDEYEVLAKKIKRDLEEEGFDVWIDKEHIRGTADWENAIEAGINSSDWVVLLMTEHSVRRPDGVCLDEISYARFLGKNIAPIMIQDVKPPLCIARIQWIDMKNFIVPGKPYFDEEAYLKRKEELLAILHGLQKINSESGQLSLRQKLNPVDNDVFSEFFRKEFYGRKKLIDKYDQWYKSENRILWLRGNAGTGKTSFIAHISNLREEIQAVHFCRYNDNERANPKRAIMSLAYYMSTQIPDYREELIKLQDLGKLIEKSTSRLFEYLIIEPLKKIQYHKQPMVIIIDALDEATFNGRNELADIVAFHFLKTPHWLKLIVTSRNEALLKRKLSPFLCIDISDDKENHSDIRGYLSTYLKDYLPTGKSKDHILDVITQKSEGLFLYAKTVADEIRKGKLSVKNTDEFPDGLTGIYLNYFNRIFDKEQSFSYKKDIRPVMEVLCTTYAPIKPENLCEILDIDEYDIDDILELLQEMFPIKNGFIEPLHKSLIDWLTTPQNSGEYRVSAKKGHKHFSDFLLKYYNMDYWKTYSIKHLCKHLLAGGNYQEAIACLNDLSRQNTRISIIGLDSALREYIHEITMLNSVSFDYVCSVFSNNTFISLFSKHRKFLYNSGLYFNLKICGLSDFLKQKNNSWDINAEIGISYYYYITEDFNRTIELVTNLLSKNDLDFVMEEELLNLIGLCYRKHVDFVKAKEQFLSAYKIGHEHNESYYQSTALINLGKISYHELDWHSATKWNKKGISCLEDEIANVENNDYKITLLLFLAEYHRLVAECLIWSGNLAEVKKELDEAKIIYNQISARDRYYIRFLYTSAFGRLLSGEYQSTFDECGLLFKQATSKYDKSQILFYQSIAALKLGMNDEAILCAKQAYELAINIEAWLEAEEIATVATLAGSLELLSQNLENPFIEKWIIHAHSFIEKL